jgi:hypothetical protein
MLRNSYFTQQDVRSYRVSARYYLPNCFGHQFWLILVDGIAREEVGAAAGYEPPPHADSQILGTLRSMSMIDYPTKGRVKAEDFIPDGL